MERSRRLGTLSPPYSPLLPFREAPTVYPGQCSTSSPTPALSPHTGPSRPVSRDPVEGQAGPKASLTAAVGWDADPARRSTGRPPDTGSAREEAGGAEEAKLRELSRLRQDWLGSAVRASESRSRSPPVAAGHTGACPLASSDGKCTHLPGQCGGLPQVIHEEPFTRHQKLGTV